MLLLLRRRWLRWWLRRGCGSGGGGSTQVPITPFQWCFLSNLPPGFIHTASDSSTITMHEANPRLLHLLLLLLPAAAVYRCM